jgi:hypothetical protein
VHTVIETPAFLRQAQLEGMSDAERGRAVSIIAANPAAGALIRGSGGCRKVRVPREGAGKSGGYRVVTYFATGRAPVFLVAVLSKTSRDNFSDKEVQAMAAMSKGLIAGLGPRAIDPEEDGDD